MGKDILEQLMIDKSDNMKGRFTRGITFGNTINLEKIKDKNVAEANFNRPIVTVPFFIGDYHRFKRAKDEDLEKAKAELQAQ